MTVWPLVIHLALAVLVVSAILVVSHLLGGRHRDRATGEPYESGMPVTEEGGARHPARYYLVAMLFVIFDLEAVFIFAWAVAARELGWTGYVEISVFIAVLLAALAYLWREGALDWNTPAPERRGAGADR